MKPIYLDHAAATPVDPGVLSVMQPFFVDNFYNPSALYSGARSAKKALEEARSLVSQTIGCRPSEVIFTAGGTESDNLAIAGVAQAYPDAHIVISSVEHDAVRASSQLFDVDECLVDSKGVVILDDLIKRIQDNTVLVSCMYANNEVGSVQPIEDVVHAVARIRADRALRGILRPLYVHTDACQASLYLDCSVARLGVDMMTLNGGKMYGPKQSGILYVRTGVGLQPQILGGGQEFGMRSGTENVAFAVGFSHALSVAQGEHNTTARALKELSSYFSKKLVTEFSAVINGHRKKRLPNNVHATFIGADNERVLFSLDDQGVYAASGSACSASSEEVSHVLRAMGVSDQDARSSLRFTLGKTTTKAELNQTIDKLRIALKA